MPTTLPIMPPLSQALARVGLTLFKPFNLRKWLLLAVPAFTIFLGATFDAVNLHHLLNIPDVRDAVVETARLALDYYVTHTWTATALLIAAATVIIAYFLVLYYLSARGTFMFLDNLARNRPAIRESWHRWRVPANSFFWFRLSWSLIGFNLFLLIAIVAGIIIWPDLWQAATDPSNTFAPTWRTPTAAILMLVSVLILGIPLVIINIWIHAFIPPLMMARNLTGWQALRHVFTHLLLAHPKSLTLWTLMYLVFTMVSSTASSLIGALGALLTCLTGPACATLPLVGYAYYYLLTIPLLPFLAFDRLYPLYFLQQLGPDYQLIEHDAASPTGFPVQAREVSR